MENQNLLVRLQQHGVGHRGFADPMFSDDKPPERLGVFDEDDESLCHQEIKTTCQVPGCSFSCNSLLVYEGHYNASHRHRCSQCRKSLPSAHLLDLHIQENHDSFFAVMATRKPCYSCYIEECKEKFNTPEERTSHCIQIHKLPKGFRFDRLPTKPKEKTKKASKTNTEIPGAHSQSSGVKLVNSKVKMFSSTSGNSSKGDKRKENLDDSNKMDVM